jgi:hypothetical protein
VVPWPAPLPDGTLLAGRAKGIYKPQWSEFALSIRQTLGGPYPDRPIKENPDGTWSYDYYQEGLEVDERDQAFTNRGLLNCWKEVIPVGVMIQTRGKPHVRYRVLGLALVTGYGEGYFSFEGISLARVAEPPSVPPPDLSIAVSQRRADLVAGAFDPSKVDDERRKTLAEITRRQGQPGFRRILLRAYDRRCPISEYDAEESLEAAHIVPYRGPVTNHPSNGLLLRADLHGLFDLGLISINPSREPWTVIVGPEIRGTRYEKFHEAALRLPVDPVLRPSVEAINRHRMEAGY